MMPRPRCVARRLSRDSVDGERSQEASVATLAWRDGLPLRRECSSASQYMKMLSRSSDDAADATVEACWHGSRPCAMRSTVMKRIPVGQQQKRQSLPTHQWQGRGCRSMN